MVSRASRTAFLAVVVATAAALSVACQSVPLLAPSGSTITLTSAASVLPLNGTAQIIAQLVEQAGTPPHEGTRVTFTTTLGRFDPPDVDTDVTGRAVTTFIAGTTSGVASITAISGGTAVTPANAVTIRIGAAAVGSVGLAASPATLPATGGTTLLTASVNDASGNALPGVPVTFAIDTTVAGGTGSFSATVANTDGNGRATTQFTTNRTTTVTATAGVATSTGGGGGTGTPPPTTTSAQTAKVIVNVNTTASITVGTPTPATPIVNQTVTLPITYGTSTTASPVTSVRVDWGDGAVATITGQPAAVSHAFGRAGSYLVVVTGTDALGDTTTTTTSITVSPRPQPTVSITATPANPQPGQAVTLTAAVTQGTTGATTQSVSWDFGDGSPPFTLPGNSLSASHIYNNSGIFIVTATVTDSTGATGTSSLPVVVGTGSPASFTFTGTIHGQSTFFDASSSSAPTRGATIVDYTYDFGDGHNASGPSPRQSNVYAAAGTYTVTLTITDSAGQKATTTKQVTIT